MPRNKKSDAGEQKPSKTLDDKILSFISHHPCSDRTTIANSVDVPVGTLNHHITSLKDEGKLQEGLTVTPEWKKQQLKTYIFIYTDYRGTRVAGVQEIPYQHDLKADIETKLQEAPYADELVLESLSIVLGAEFDLILVLTAQHMRPINQLVTTWLRIQPAVAKTQTIMVGPSEQGYER